MKLNLQVLRLDLCFLVQITQLLGVEIRDSNRLECSVLVMLLDNSPGINKWNVDRNEFSLAVKLRTGVIGFRLKV